MFYMPGINEYRKRSESNIYLIRTSKDQRKIDTLTLLYSVAKLPQYIATMYKKNHETYKKFTFILCNFSVRKLFQIFLRRASYKARLLVITFLFVVNICLQLSAFFPKFVSTSSFFCSHQPFSCLPRLFYFEFFSIRSVQNGSNMIKLDQIGFLTNQKMFL